MSNADRLIDLAYVAARARDPIQLLEALSALRRVVDQGTIATVRPARDGGVSWAAIGGCLGMTRQRAHERYARYVRNVVHTEAAQTVSTPDVDPNGSLSPDAAADDLGDVLAAVEEHFDD